MSPHSVTEQIAPARSRPSAVRSSVSVSNLSNPYSAPLAFQLGGVGNVNRNNVNGTSFDGKSIASFPSNLLHSAPASPPTPAPSPTPYQKSLNWHFPDEYENAFLLSNVRGHFSSLPNAEKLKFLEGVLSLCDMPQLSFVSGYVSPRLRKDPFVTLPTELCLRVRWSTDLYVYEVKAFGQMLTPLSLVRYFLLSMILGHLQGQLRYRIVGENS